MLQISNKDKHFKVGLPVNYWFVGNTHVENSQSRLGGGCGLNLSVAGDSGFGPRIVPCVLSGTETRMLLKIAPAAH
jgi:hypothetical protein